MEKKSSEVILGEKGHDEICNGVIYLRVVMSFCNGLKFVDRERNK